MIDKYIVDLRMMFDTCLFLGSYSCLMFDLATYIDSLDIAFTCYVMLDNILLCWIMLDYVRLCLKIMLDYVIFFLFTY